MNHQHYMKRCLELAARGKGTTAPNPMVGAVLVHQGRVIGEGFHERYGQAHAEVNCLDSVKEQDRSLIPGSTMYVNLEPCAVRLAEERVKEVIVCNMDPFDDVNGRGFGILKKHNVPFQNGILEEQGLWQNRRFFCFHKQHRPYIILKWAQTGQGYFAPLNRTRFQMSNKNSQQLAHKWRTEEAAILVGTTTAIQDDPQLTARLWQGQQPVRIVIDKTLQLPGSSRVFSKEAASWIVNAIYETERDNIRYVKLDFDKDLLPQLLDRLYLAGILSLIVEGGARLLNSFITGKLWDEARVFETPDILQEGIHAPVLTGASKAFTSRSGTDHLHVYVNSDSAYQYVTEMEL